MYKHRNRRNNHNRFSGNRFPQQGRKNHQKGNDINISDFINKAQQAVPAQNVVEGFMAQLFTEFSLSASIHEAIRQRGYEKPTPIQSKAIPHVLRGEDVLGLANTGTGKTGAFLIPLLDKLIKKPSEKVLIIVPTRELAIQIEEEFQALTRNLRFRSVLCIGGTSMYRQRGDLTQAYNFMIATPGRLKDLANQKLVNLNQFNTIVLDEVDRMLDMGFIHDVREILNALPSPRHSLFFSATATKEVTGLIAQFSHNLVTVSVKTQESAATIEQDVIRITKPEEKLETLYNLLTQKDFEKVLIFGRTKHGVHKLSRKLNEWGFKCDSIHGNKSQPQRQQALTRFKQNAINILVATDVAARGLDIADISHVINYDVPATYEDYIHRIGRTGRGEKQGKALTFIS